jgi:hypothetical protein
MAKVMRILDVEALIDAVRDRPALWDLLFNEAALYTMKGTSENNYKTFPGV